MKLKLNTIVVEIDEGLNVGIEYYLKINEKKIGEVEPHVYSLGEDGISSPEVQEIHKYLYPLTGVFFQPRQRIMAGVPDSYCKSDTYDGGADPCVFCINDFVSAKQTFVYKCTIKNTVSAPMVIQSVILPASVIGFTLSLSGGLESISTDYLVPEFEMFNNSANLIGAPFGYLMDYIYVIPEDTSFDFYLFIDDECHIKYNTFTIIS